MSETQQPAIESTGTVSYYALEQLEAAKRLILQTCIELPQIRAEVDKNMNTSRKNAKDWYSVLISLHQKLLEALKNCRLALLEAEQEKLADTTLSLIKSVSGFNLMTPDYTKFIAVLQQYADMLPDEQNKKVSARIIGRLMNNVRTGYYPTDLIHIQRLAQAIVYPEDITVNLLDPCCGCGLALHRLGFGEKCTTFGVELDESRAEEAQTRLNRVAFGSFFGSRIARDSFHAMLLNPPYLSVMTESGSKARHEKRFLIESMDNLMLGGLLIYIIPYYRLTEDIARVLCDNFTDISVYRFMEDEFKKFKQIVILGSKQRRLDGSAFVSELLERVVSADKIPEISKLPKERYALPTQGREVQIFKGAVFNVAELAAQLEKSDSFHKLLKESELDKSEKRPMLPLKAGQVGLIGGSGMINGLAECENPHIIKGRIIKEIIIEEEETKLDKQNRAIVTERTETHTNKLVFNILTMDGFKSLTQ